jgi:hypothetical protein
MIAVGIWVPQLKEIRRKEKFKGTKELKKLIIREARPTILEDVHEIQAIPHYLREK